jgi:putative phosphoribosyl transferase
MTTATTTRFPTAETELEGDLSLPRHAHGVVIFAHGTGSTRHSPRNRLIAAELNKRSLGTLLIDLLTPDEEVVDARGRDLRFDVGLLADRVIGLVDWLGSQESTRTLPVGLFGASTGAAAVLVAAASRPDDVHAVVCRGGRPDLAGPALIQVAAPTLLIVGERDVPVVELNEQARHAMTATTELHVVPGATHLFEEEGALEVVAEEAGTWFASHLR